MRDQRHEQRQALIEAFDSLAANARYHAHVLRRRWWRAFLDDASVSHWRGQIVKAEHRAFVAQVNAATLRVIAQAADPRDRAT